MSGAPLHLTVGTLLALPAFVVSVPHPAPPALAAAGGEFGGPFQLDSARLRQIGPELLLDVRTVSRLRIRALRNGRSLCLELVPRGRSMRRVCLRSGPDGKPRLLMRRVGDARRRMDGSVIRRGSRRVHLRFAVDEADVPLGWVRWATTANWNGGDRLPPVGIVRLRVRRARLAGCTYSGPSFKRYGSRAKREVALTFDDGPSAYTDRFRRVLRHHGARATFFELGAQVGRYAATSRRLVRDGNEIGNHGWAHGASTRGGLLATNARIRRTTGFTPCVFRAPGGAFGGGVVTLARELGMTSIGWDVDPRDWALPGTWSIAAGVLGAVRPGSIVVMHDGGGPRGQTLAALPSILRGLRARGYSAVTVTELLGGRPIWRYE